MIVNHYNTYSWNDISDTTTMNFVHLNKIYIQRDGVIYYNKFIIKLWNILY